MKKMTLPLLQKKKEDQEKIVMITAYSASIAHIIDPITDIILVGDSLGMTLHGLPSTVQVTEQMMILAAQSVNRSRKNAFMVVDLPFSSYESSPEKAYETAAYMMQETGCEAIKLEGGSVMAPTIEFLSRRNIPVMGHVGLLPQSVNFYGGYGARGKEEYEQKKLLQDIKDVDNAGAFSIVIEGVTHHLAQKMVESVSCLTFGIGACSQCDGQVLVSDDILGITPKTARFVKRYGEIGEDMTNIFSDFAHEVRSGIFPSEQYFYAQDKG